MKDLAAAKAAISVFKERVKIWINDEINQGLCARSDVTRGWWISGRASRSSLRRRLSGKPGSYGLAQPVLAPQVCDAGEFLLVVRHDGVAQCECLGGDEQIIGANRFPSPLQFRTQ